MFQRIFLTLILLCVPFAAQAVQTADMSFGQTTVGPNDVLRGRFVEERHLTGFDGPMQSSGHFVIVPSKGLIWAMEKPFPTTTIITPNGLVQMIGTMKIAFMPAQKMPFLLHLYDMLGGALAGDWSPLSADFDVARSGTGADGWQANLTPRRADNPAMPFSLIAVKGHSFVEAVNMQKANGDFDNIAFSSTNLSQTPLTATETAAYRSVHP